MFASDVLLQIVPGLRPSFNPITLVGVFSFASFRSSATSCGVQSFLEFLVDFAIQLISDRYVTLCCRGCTTADVEHASQRDIRLALMVVLDDGATSINHLTEL
jgi:hypothetical protein